MDYFDIIAIGQGRETRMNATPLTEKEAETMLSKFTPRPKIRTLVIRKRACKMVSLDNDSERELARKCV